jgi:hypothetical protein
MFNTDTVVHIIGDPCLKLYRHGKSYWYFAFDEDGLCDTHRIYVKHLNDLPLATWVNEGRTFATAMRVKREGDGQRSKQ